MIIIVKWCVGVACNWYVSLDIALILAVIVVLSNYANVNMWLYNVDVHDVISVDSSRDVRRQVSVRLVQEDLHALRHLLLQQPRVRAVQVLRLTATSDGLVKRTQQERT